MTMAMTLRASENNRSFGRGNEIILRNEPVFKLFLNRFKENRTIDKFDPKNDERMAKCYDFLYQKKGEKDLKDWADLEKKGISMERAVLTGRLYALMMIDGGNMQYDYMREFVELMEKNADKALHTDGTDNSIPALRREFFYENNPLDVDGARKLGAIQLLNWVESVGKVQLDESGREMEKVVGSGGNDELEMGIAGKANEARHRIELAKGFIRQTIVAFDRS